MNHHSREHMVSYSVFTGSDADEMAQLLGEVFARRDPPAVAVGLTPAEFEFFVRLWCPKAEAEGLTIVARSSITGEMIGALLAEDSASPVPDGATLLSAKFDPIRDILGQLEADYRAYHEVLPGDSLHLFLVGVDERFAGHGIASQLITTCMASGATKGFRVAVTEATNMTSQHVFRKLGFTDQVGRSYRDHRFEGRAVFESIADHGGPILMEKQLTDQQRDAADGTVRRG